MGETTQEERDRWRRVAGENNTRLLNDADRLAEAESLLREAREYSDIQTSDILADKIDAFLSGGG